MANGFRTGVSAVPVDVTGLGDKFFQSAVEAKLAEIESDRVQVSDNAERVLKAMSINTTAGLTQKLQDRYSKEIEDYRGRVLEEFKDSRGKLTLNQQRKIQDGFADLEGRMANDINYLKRIDEARKVYASPNARYSHNVEAGLRELAMIQDAFERGERVTEDPLASTFKHVLTPSTVDYAFNRYGNEIKGLDKVTSGQWVDENTFRFTTQESEDEVNRVVDRIFEQDPVLQQKAINPETGQLDLDLLQQEKETLKDAVIRASTTIRPFRGRTGDRDSVSRFDFPVSLDRGVDRVKSGDDNINVDYAANIALEPVGFITFEGERMSPEAIRYMPVPKGEKLPKAPVKRIVGVDIGKKPKLTRQGIIPQDQLKFFNERDIEYKPFIKVSVPKGFSFDEDKSDVENNLAYFEFLRTGGETRARFIPFEGAIRDQVYSNLGRKAEGLVNALESAESQVVSSRGEIEPTPDEPERFSPIQEAGIDAFMRSQNISREEAIRILRENGRL